MMVYTSDKIVVKIKLQKEIYGFVVEGAYPVLTIVDCFLKLKILMTNVPLGYRLDFFLINQFNNCGENS